MTSLRELSSLADGKQATQKSGTGRWKATGFQCFFFLLLLRRLDRLFRQLSFRLSHDGNSHTAHAAIFEALCRTRHRGDALAAPGDVQIERACSRKDAIHGIVFFRRSRSFLFFFFDSEELFPVFFTATSARTSPPCEPGTTTRRASASLPCQATRNPLQKPSRASQGGSSWPRLPRSRLPTPARQRRPRRGCAS